MSAALVLQRQFKYEITVMNQGQSHIYEFEKAVVTVGRGENNDIVIKDDPKVSRNHLEIKIQGESLIVKNISKKNTILINGLQVQEQALSAQATVKMGSTELLIHFQPPAPIVPKSEVIESRAVEVATAPKASPPWITGQQAKSASLASKPTHSTPIMDVGYSPPPQYSNPSRKENYAGPSAGGSRVPFYLGIVVLGLAAYLFLSDSAKKKAEPALRNQDEVIKSISQSANAVKELSANQDRTGKDSVQFRSAQEHYLKGFRDYRQGQYARAIQSFQAALAFYPDHEMAKKYWNLSKRKFDETVQAHMNQGRKYLGKNNYRMCVASFRQVMIMLKDPNDLIYKEAKQLNEECSARLEGGY